MNSLASWTWQSIGQQRDLDICESCSSHVWWGIATCVEVHSWTQPFPWVVACSEIKERTKKAKADKQQQKLQSKAAGGKAVKNMPKGAGKAGAKSTGR
jgi:hypothetical protein